MFLSLFLKITNAMNNYYQNIKDDIIDQNTKNRFEKNN